MSRLSWQGYSIGVLLIRYQVCWLLVSGDGEEGGYVAGSWVGQMLWEQLSCDQDLNLIYFIRSHFALWCQVKIWY